MRKVLFLTLVLVALFAVNAFADTAVIRIFDEETRLPVAGASVRLVNGLSSEYAITDANGRVVFTNVSSGSYGVIINAEGYETGEGEIEVLGVASRNFIVGQAGAA